MTSMNPPIFKTMMFLEGDLAIYEVDTIEFEGALWLVPEWLMSAKGEFSIPARIICLSVLQHSGQAPQFSLAHPLPRAVFEGRYPLPLEGVWIVRERPDIRFHSLPPHPPEKH